MKESNAAILARNYREKKARGLVDVKYYVTNGDATLSVIQKEAVNLDRAIEDGSYEPLVFNDRLG